MTPILHDLRLARRQLTKSPLFTTIVIATLALAIGLNSAVFSAVEALMLKPIPGVRNPESLVQLYRTYPGGMDYGSNSIPHYQDIRDRTGDVFSGVALWNFDPMNISARGEPRRVMGAIASAGYFSVLGATPFRGRFFVPQEDTGRLAHRVTVLSHAAWKGLFGADSGIVGREIVINGHNYQVVGIAAPEFGGSMPMVTPVLWVPLTQLAEIEPGSEARWERRGSNSFNIVARLRDNVSIEAADTRVATLLTELRSTYPDDYNRTGIKLYSQLEAGIHPSLKGAQVGLSAVVMAVVAILLLIACLNVANLFLARGRDRAREMAVRLSLGASRSALVRQLLVESLVFAAVSAVVGLGIAQWAIALVNQVSLPFDVDFRAGLELSPTVLVGTLVTAVVAAIVFGIAPAVQATRPSLIPALKGEAPAGESRSRVRSGLVVAQMALSIVLLVCAGLFLRNLGAATAVDKGFQSDNLAMAELDPGMQGYPRPRTEQFYRDLKARLLARPGVKSVAFAQSVPLGLGESDTGVEVPGYVPGDNENMNVQYNAVTEDYFTAMGIRLLAGRAIEARDDSAAAKVLVVNEHFAKKYFAGKEAVGSTVRVSGADRTIIGVVPTGKYVRLGEPITAFMYFPQAQRFNSGLIVHVRTERDPETIIAGLRADVASLDATLPLANVKTMDRHLGISLLPARLSGAVLGVFGLIGLVLAAIGMYGVMAYSVAQRTREIGIRMAIGAAASDVVQLVMKQGFRLVFIGGMIGLAGAFAVSRALASVLYGGGQNDVLTFIVVPVVLTSVAMLASWVPARRAANTDPLKALRQE
ncbi:MAG: ABC transporter permease [Gemmatimonadota bacterium]|nr:ABC transporter permease [Gemmatimonadota bacterium]